MLRTEIASQGAEMRIGVEENEVGERPRELDYRLVGKWRGGSNPSSDLETMRTWGKFLWNLEWLFKVVQMGRGLLLLEFHNPMGAKRVLKTGKRIFEGKYFQLERWSCAESSEKLGKT